MPPERTDLDVGIIVALREEFRELHALLPPNISIKDESTGTSDYFFNYPTSKGEHYRCAATFVGTMGPTEAALATQRFLERRKPITIVMLGIAAGINSDVRLGDVVVATNVARYLDRAKIVDGSDGHFDIRAGGDSFPCSADLVRATLDFEFAHRTSHDMWADAASVKLASLVPDAQRTTLMNEECLHSRPKFIDGAVASGPVVAASVEFVNWLRSVNRNYLALEMEGGAMLAAVYSRADTARSLMLRGISDFGDDRKGTLDAIGKGGLRRYAMQNATTLLWGFLDVGMLPRAPDITALTHSSIGASNDAIPNAHLQELLALAEKVDLGILVAALKSLTLVTADEASLNIGIPPSVVRLARRHETVTILREAVAATAWTSVLGARESGKTQLAVLVAGSWNNVYWFTRDSLASGDDLAKRLRGIGQSSQGRTLCEAAVNAMPQGSLLVLDDLPVLDSNDDRTGMLRDLAKAALGHVHVLSLSTGRVPQSVRDVLGDGFAARDAPPFSNEEARELALAYGAPDELPDAAIEFLNALAKGNPTLLTALSEYLRARVWRIDAEEIRALLTGAHLNDVGREVMARLREDVQDESTRQLFSRTRVARYSLTLAEIRELAEINPMIDRVTERLFELDGLWLRREAGDRYVPAPLASALPAGDLPLAVERRCHILLAERIIEGGRISPHGVINAVWHFIQAQEFDRAGSVLAAALVKIIELEAWDERLIPAIFTAEPLPKEMALHLRLFIRTQQLKIARKQEKRQIELLRDASTLLVDAGPKDAAVVVTFAVEVAREDTDDHETWSVAMNAVERVLDLQPAADGVNFLGQPLPLTTWGILFYLVGRMVRTVADVDRWTAAADRLAAPKRQQILASAFDRQSLINAAWLRHWKSPAPPWKDVLAVHRRWRDWAQRTGDSLLWAYAVRAELIVRAEYMNDADEAFTFATEQIKFATGAHERFILRDALATQLRRLRLYDEAERGYASALEDIEAATNPEQVYMLGNAASVVAKHDPLASARLLERAQRIIRESPEEFDPTRGAIVSADLGLAYWYGGSSIKASAEWESVATILLDDSAIEAVGRHALVGLLTIVLGQVARGMRVGPEKDLPVDERAVVGTFDRDLKELAPYWKPAQAALLATELAQIAAGVGRDYQAQAWITRAESIACQLNEPVVLSFVAMEALPWTLLDNDFVNAGRQIAELCGLHKRPQNSGDSELAHYVLLASFQLCALTRRGDGDRARAGAAGLAAAFRDLPGERDAQSLAHILDVAVLPDAAEQLTAECSQASAGNAVSAVSRLFRSCSPGRNTSERAADHLTIGPLVHNRASLWGVGYHRIVLSFFYDFWRLEAEINAFRFRSPASFRRELDELRLLAPERRLQAMLGEVSEALGLDLSREFRDWFRTGRNSSTAASQ